MSVRSLLLVALSVFSLTSAVAALGCGSSNPKGPVVQPSGAAEVQKGYAEDDNTWMTLASHGARLRVPQGWHYETQGDKLVAEPHDGRAAIVLEGALSKSELEAKVRALGNAYKLEKVDFGKAKPGKINGIDVVMFEDMVAISNGKPADVFVLLGEAPNGKGVVIVFVMAWDATQTHDQRLIDAANSLRPI